MPFRVGPTELVLILLLALLLFGPGRLSHLARELGQSIREFRRGLTAEEEKKPEETPREPPTAPRG
ncbi:MAG: twin-arginine translocase TatA/TatE family subunit [Thermoflexus sp.]|uniref:Sec-independent protein translocase subunit TatA/TatB n=1 Tax=Thermoflexus sp. TaxID=1969742 RepID=UPI003324A429